MFFVFLTVAFLRVALALRVFCQALIQVCACFTRFATAARGSAGAGADASSSAESSSAKPLFQAPIMRPVSQPRSAFSERACVFAAQASIQACASPVRRATSARENGRGRRDCAASAAYVDASAAFSGVGALRSHALEKTCSGFSGYRIERCQASIQTCASATDRATAAGSYFAGPAPGKEPRFPSPTRASAAAAERSAAAPASVAAGVSGSSAGKETFISGTFTSKLSKTPLLKSIAGIAGSSTAGASNVGASKPPARLGAAADGFAPEGRFAEEALFRFGPSAVVVLPASRSAPRPTTASSAAAGFQAAVSFGASPEDHRGLVFLAPPPGGFAGGAFRAGGAVLVITLVCVFVAGATAVLNVMMLERTSVFFLVCVAADAAVPSRTALVAAAATAAPSASSTAGPAVLSPPNTTVAPRAAAARIAGAGPEPAPSEPAPEPDPEPNPPREEEEEPTNPLYEGTYAVPAVLRMGFLPNALVLTMLDLGVATRALLLFFQPGRLPPDAPGPFLLLPLTPSTAARPTANAVLTRLAVSSAAVAALPKRFRPVAGALFASIASMLAGRKPLASIVSR